MCLSVCVFCSRAVIKGFFLEVLNAWIPKFWLDNLLYSSPFGVEPEAVIADGFMVNLCIRGELILLNNSTLMFPAPSLPTPDFCG